MRDPIEFSYTAVNKDLYWKAAQWGGKSLDSGSKIGWALKFALWLVLVAVMVALLQLPILQKCGPAFLLGTVFTAIALLLISRVQRSRFITTFERDQSKRGEVAVSIGADGCKFSSSFGDTHLTWFAIDTVIDLGTGTGLRSGLLVYPLPDADLPSDITPAAFRQALNDWKAAAA
mgnify:CR=1 FL=1